MSPGGQHQRYVSDELTHFVGRGKKPDEQYSLLVKILKEGVLRAGGGGSISPGDLIRKYRLGGKMSEVELFSAAMVCFCDIPVADFAIHVEKYSRFGLAFAKTFLTPKGAAPVFYLPKGAPILEVSRAAYLDDAGEEIRAKWLGDLFSEPRPTPTALRRFLEDVVIFYLKPFDETKSNDDPDSFYMEREWRVLTSVAFGLADVRRILIPESYAAKLRDDIPEYFGQVSFVD